MKQRAARRASNDRSTAPNDRSAAGDLRHTANQSVAAPAALLRYQQKWVEEKADVAVWEKTRRCGASWCDASDSVLLSAAEGGQDSLYIGYSEDMTREYIDDCAMWAKAFNRAASEMQEVMFEDTDDSGDVRHIKAFRIDFASGFKILALSSRPRSIRGKQGKVTIDEAAFHDDLPGLLKAALAMLIWGGRVRIISSHNGTENPFNELVLDIRAGKKPYALHRTTIDDALADGLYKRICLRKGIPYKAENEKAWREDLFAKYSENTDEELFCVPSQGSGIWLPRALIEARMMDAPVIRYRAPKGADLWGEETLHAEIADFCERELRPLLEKLDPKLRSAFGVDFGRHVDLSAIAPCQLQQNLKRTVPFLVELADCPFKAQEQILFYIADRLPLFSHGMLDAGGNGSYLAEQARRKYGETRITSVVFSETWYRENTAPLKAAFQDDGIELPKDVDVVSDLAAFRLVKGTPRIPDLRVTDARGQKRHGDAGIAVLLGYMATRQDYVPMEFQSSGMSRPSRGIGDFMGGLNG
jgi:phage FluMu gp28-like protein